MKNTVLLLALLIFALFGLGTSGCTKGNSIDTVNSATSFPTSGNFRFSLTDAPHPSLSHVIANVDHVEILLQKEDQSGRVVIGQGLGPIDLLKLRDGVHLPIRDLNLRESVIVKQFRLVLKDEGNWIERIADGSICNLKIPSENKTGLKVIIPGGGVQVEAGSDYSLIVDFDVDHSIVDNKNNCLLKPVLKIKSLSQIPSGSDDGNNNGDDNSGTTTTPGDNTSGDNSSGSTPTSPGSDTSSGTDTSSSGTTTTTTPGDTTTTTTLPNDGSTAPIIDESNPDFFILD